MITPQYIADLVAWGAIGARTTESQVAPRTRLRPVVPGRLQERHRRQRPDRRRRDQGRAAAPPFPVGHEGRATPPSSRPRATRTATSSCAAARRRTSTPPASRRRAPELGEAGLAQRLMIDASHANSQKNHENQVAVCENIGAAGGGRRRAHHRRHGREPPGRRAPGPRARQGR